MQLEDQVCSLELAKRLKKSGVKQESQFIWGDRGDEVFLFFRSASAYVNQGLGYFRTFPHDIDYAYAAFTVAELGEMLPITLKAIAAYQLPSRISATEWHWFKKVEHGIQDQIDHTEADARTNLLIYLLENKLITL
jgi:hypothetical protein